MNRFQDKVVLITGASSGIGKATALAFAAEGAKLVLAARREDKGQEVVKAIEAKGGEAIFVRCDVAVDADLKRVVEQAVATYGRLDVAFNNAGVEGQINVLATDTSDEDYQHVFDINVKGVISSMKYEIRQMMENGGGAIINMSSIAGVVGLPGASIYVASKHAVMGLTRSAALEWAAQGVRINAVNPAVIETDMADRFLSSNEAGKEAAAEAFKSMHPAGRFGKPEEIASVVLWLASNESSYVFGQGINIDGGFTAN